ncbi:MAG: GIY-YIG nuclease family protein [FCB group bacterium]|nr:GIY-YIG nuclease family protein [FCB group bacterium]
MYFTYILYSASTDRYYIGYTSDLEDRLRHHNSGGTKTTKRGIPWKIVYNESHGTKHDAVMREREIKKKKSRKHIEYLISQGVHSLTDCSE